MAEEFFNPDLAHQAYGERQERKRISKFLSCRVGAPCAICAIDLESYFPKMTEDWCHVKCGLVSDADCWMELFGRLKEEKDLSIFSDHKVGALSDEEFEFEGIRMNNEDRAERDKLFEMDREAEECFQKACERDD